MQSLTFTTCSLWSACLSCPAVFLDKSLGLDKTLEQTLVSVYTCTDARVIYMPTKWTFTTLIVIIIMYWYINKYVKTEKLFKFFTYSVVVTI